MHFIPNPANTEFIYLTGLEECVNRILNLDAVPPAMPTPFSCSQCGTDFTPTWKWDKAAKGKQIKEIWWQTRRLSLLIAKGSIFPHKEYYRIWT